MWKLRVNYAASCTTREFIEIICGRAFAVDVPADDESMKESSRN